MPYEHKEGAMPLPHDVTPEEVFIVWLLANPIGRIIYAEANEDGEIDPDSIEEMMEPSEDEDALEA